MNTNNDRNDPPGAGGRTASDQHRPLMKEPSADIDSDSGPILPEYDANSDPSLMGLDDHPEASQAVSLPVDATSDQQHDQAFGASNHARAQSDRTGSADPDSLTPPVGDLVEELVAGKSDDHFSLMADDVVAIEAARNQTVSSFQEEAEAAELLVQAEVPEEPPTFDATLAHRLW